VFLLALLDGDGTGQGLPGRDEGDHEPVAERFDLVAVMRLDAAAYDILVRPAGGGVTTPSAKISGALDVSEEDCEWTLGKLFAQRIALLRPPRGDHLSPDPVHWEARTAWHSRSSRSIAVLVSLGSAFRVSGAGAEGTY
jgi:hypothetical protein